MGKKSPTVQSTLIELVTPEVAGDPVKGQRWIVRSLPQIQAALDDQGQKMSHETIRRLLHKHKISPKAHVKRLVPRPHPERDTPFQYILAQRAAFEVAGWPIISVDSKKKELIGLFRQPGQTWGHEAQAVYMHDFANDALGRAVPYGIYDLRQQQGYMYVGQSADTPDFAVESIAHWWHTVGQHTYPDAPEVLIVADGGGSNGYRPRRWKQQLQARLADACALTVTIAHYPPGASKWNPIEHRLFSQISHAFAGTPLTSFEIMLDAIRSTTTTTGLSVLATLVDKQYPKALTVSDDEMAALLIEKHTTCPDWNYTIRPRLNREVIS